MKDEREQLWVETEEAPWQGAEVMGKAGDLSNSLVLQEQYHGMEGEGLKEGFFKRGGERAYYWEMPG